LELERWSLVSHFTRMKHHTETTPSYPNASGSNFAPAE
jgi:hypothetical protein